MKIIKENKNGFSVQKSVNGVFYILDKYGVFHARFETKKESLKNLKKH